MRACHGWPDDDDGRGVATELSRRMKCQPEFDSSWKTDDVKVFVSRLKPRPSRPPLGAVFLDHLKVMPTGCGSLGQGRDIGESFVCSNVWNQNFGIVA